MEAVDLKQVAEFQTIIPMDQVMDPLTEDLTYADYLAEGMIVLIEPNHRRDTTMPAFADSLPVVNRWCEVTELRVDEVSVHFIGLYIDGQKAIRTSEPTTGWLYKKDTAPVEEEHGGLIKGLELPILSGTTVRREPTE